MEKTYTIMFVCTGNTCRSPMAAAALNKLLEEKCPGRFRVISSGTHAADGFPATKYAVEAARIWDCDISSHKSRQLSRKLIDESDLVFAMAPEHLAEVRRLAPTAKERSYLLKSFPSASPDGDGVEDPIGQPLDKYNEVFLEISEYLGKNLDEIVERINARFRS